MTETEALRQDFIRYLRRSRLRGTYLAINLEAIVRDWLALPVYRERYRIDCRPPGDVVALQAELVGYFRRRWSQKAANTRKAKTKASSTQLSFKF